MYKRSSDPGIQLLTTGALPVWRLDVTDVVGSGQILQTQLAESLCILQRTSKPTQ